MRHTSQNRCNGFTLLEIIVTLAVVSLIFGIAISRMDTMLEWDMKRTSNKLASTVRYLYNKAASEGLYIRLVLDIDENVYWVEATSDPFVISAGEEGTPKKEKKAAEEGAVEEGGTSAPSGEGESYAIKPSKPVFTQTDSYLLKPTKLPDSVFLKDVYVEHQRTAVDSGKAYIYFFPNGYVEHAVINLRNEDDDVHYSVETNPISGRVNIEDSYRTMEEK